MTAIGADDPRRNVLQEMHRAVLAEMIARQLTPAWRTLWPWGAWIALTGLFVQVGYNTADWKASGDAWDYYDFSARVLGDPLGGIFIPFVLLISMQVFVSYVITLTGRADTARLFYSDAIVLTPKTMTQYSSEAELGRLARRARAAEKKDKEKPGWKRRRGELGMWLLYFMPGLFAACFGVMIGLYVWLAQGADDRTEAIESLGPFVVLATLPFSVSAMGVLQLWAITTRDLRELSLPSDYPNATKDQDASDALPGANEVAPPVHGDTEANVRAAGNANPSRHTPRNTSRHPWPLRLLKGPLTRLAAQFRRYR